MERPRIRPRDLSLLMLVAVGLCLPVLYFLSIGPAYWLEYHDFISGDAYSIYVAPLSFVTPPDSPLADLERWYLSFFGPGTS